MFRLGCKASRSLTESEPRSKVWLHIIDLDPVLLKCKIGLGGFRERNRWRSSNLALPGCIRIEDSTVYYPSWVIDSVSLMDGFAYVRIVLTSQEFLFCAILVVWVGFGESWIVS